MNEDKYVQDLLEQNKDDKITDVMIGLSGLDINPEIIMKSGRKQNVLSGLGAFAKGWYDAELKRKMYKNADLSKKELTASLLKEPRKQEEIKQKKLDYTLKLAKSFQDTAPVKNFFQISNSMTALQNALNNPGAMSDLAVIYSYIKVLDPGSVVREGEVGLMNKAKSLWTQIQSIWQKVEKGRQLTDEQRAEIKRLATSLYNMYDKQFNEVAEPYRKVAQEFGLDENLIITPLLKYEQIQLQKEPEIKKEIKKTKETGIDFNVLNAYKKLKEKQRKGEATPDEINTIAEFEKTYNIME